MKTHTYLYILIIFALMGFNDICFAQDDLNVEEILKEAGSAREKEKQPEKDEIEKIEKQSGEYKGFKLPWFSSLQNPSLGVVVDVLMQSSDRKNSHDSANRIDMREAELILYSNIDPFIQGNVLIAMGGHHGVEVEEASLLCTGLPFNLQLKAGKFLPQICRLNKVHTHDLPFVEHPVTMQNFLGAIEKIEADDFSLDCEPHFCASGAELAWLAPTKYYWRIIAGMLNGFSQRGEDTFYAQFIQRVDGVNPAYRNFDDFAYTVSSKWFFQLNQNHSLKINLSGIFDSPDSDNSRKTQSVAMTYKWFPLKSGLYKSLEWSTEAFFNQEKFNSPEIVNTHGFYSYVNYKLNRLFSIGVIGEWSLFRYDSGKKAIHLGTALSYQPSERQRVRLEIGYYDREAWLNAAAAAAGKIAGDGKFWQVLIQWSAVMGSHVHSYE